MEPEFKNRVNERIEAADGRVLFLSRSLAVCVPITAITEDGELYSLISKRGSETPNFQYHYNLICGYLDYDEDLYDAARREVWEESGLNIEAIKDSDMIYKLKQDPWEIKSSPNGKVQNVTMRYGLFFKCKDQGSLPKLSIEYSEPNEVIESVWMKNKDVLNIVENGEEVDPNIQYVWAFNHYSVYREWLEKIEKLIK